MMHGNFDSDSSQELVLVGGSSEGRVILLDYNSSSREFESNWLWWDPNGALMDVVAADLDETYQGSEILVGGFSGNLTQLSFDNKRSIKNKTIWNTPINENTKKYTNIFGLAAGDVNKNAPGVEIAVADATNYFLYILSKNSTKWEDEKVMLDDIPRDVFIGDFDQDYPGAELLVICVNGSVYRVAQDDVNDAWDPKLIFKDSMAPMSTVIEDINTSHPGLEVIISGLSKNATLIWGSGKSWNNNTIWHAPGALEGMAYGEFDDLHDGPELIIAGYSNTAVMLYDQKLVDQEWYTETIFYDPNPLQTELNGAVVTDFYPEHDGTELALVGFTGNVTMLVFEPPNFRLTTPSAKKVITAGEFTTFRVELETMSGYDDDVRISQSGLPDDINHSYSRKVLSSSTGTGGGQETGVSVLTIDTFIDTIPGYYNFTIFGVGISSNKNNSLDLMLEIRAPPPKPTFELHFPAEKSILNLTKGEYWLKFNISLIPINDFKGNAEIFVPEDFLKAADIKNTLIIGIKPNKIGTNDKAVINITIAESFKESKNFSIPIHGINITQDIDSMGEIEFETIYFDESEDNNGTNGSSLPLDLILAIIILLIVIFMLLSFIIIRARASRFDKNDDEKIDS
jgi:hypothetical protein